MNRFDSELIAIASQKHGLTQIIKEIKRSPEQNKDVLYRILCWVFFILSSIANEGFISQALT